jgi:protoporphyrinogen oxidase
MTRPDEQAVVIGAGPAGLSAAHELLALGSPAILLEKAAVPGGISRTETWEGYHFDIGGHRFFTRYPGIQTLWQELLGDELIQKKRASRILFNGRFFHYPLDLPNVLRNVSFGEGTAIVASYLAARLRVFADDRSFEDWVIHRFGKRLYATFFKPYTEKVWGIPCREIQIDWAAQRIGQLSLRRALINALSGIATSRTQIDHFLYPVTGPGLMWQRMVEKITTRGGQIRFNTPVVRVERTRNHIDGVVVRDGNDKETVIRGRDFISSMPIGRLVQCLSPAAPAIVRHAADNLSYRDFISVNLIVNRDELFPDQWIYIQDERIHAGRIQNFKNWSEHMVPDPSKTSIGMEYFCSVGDPLWNRTDSELIALASDELAAMKLARRHDVLGGVVYRQRRAYPVYQVGFEKHVTVLRDYLSSFSNLQTIGRNGLHRYNNMDHSMMTGILAAGNIVHRKYDLWRLNDWEKGKQEREGASLEPLEAATPVLSENYSKMDKLSCGLATGAVAGLALLAATLWLVIKGGPVVGPNLQLLAQYFYGYTVTFPGAFIGFAYAGATGFAAGWLFALLRNLAMAVFIVREEKKKRTVSVKDTMNYL